MLIYYGNKGGFLMREGIGDIRDFYIFDLINYYNNKGLAIIGLNDSQGVDITSTFFRRGLLEYIADELTIDEFKPKVIDTFSLLMNKTEHIDYMLKNNLSLEEIKLSQVYSAVSALEKVMADIHLPRFLGKVGNVYKLVYAPKRGDGELFITDTLRFTEEPTVIYSSGVNNLMREVSSDPFTIKKQYKRRNITPDFSYTYNKAKDPKTLDNVIEGIEKNFANILSINDKTDIYTLGAYVPKSLQKEDMDVFRELIIKYNERLEKLCGDYYITFINTDILGNKYNNSDVNFHISSEGYSMLFNYIIEKMYERKILNNDKYDCNSLRIFSVTNGGVTGMIEDLNGDCDKCIERAHRLSGYDKMVESKIALEHLREVQVFRKVRKRVNCGK